MCYKLDQRPMNLCKGYSGNRLLAIQTENIYAGSMPVGHVLVNRVLHRLCNSLVLVSRTLRACLVRTRQMPLFWQFFNFWMKPALRPACLGGAAASFFIRVAVRLWLDAKKSIRLDEEIHRMPQRTQHIYDVSKFSVVAISALSSVYTFSSL